MTQPALSVVCLCSSRPERVRKLRSAIASQTAGDRVELVLVGGHGQEADLDGVKCRSIDWPLETPFGEARAAGVRAAGGEIIAFLRDHCVPGPGWAEALIEAYRGGWAAVGYGYRHLNPGGYASDAIYLASFGVWLGLRPGQVASLPGIDVSYRRDELLRFGRALGDLLEIDASIHRLLLESGRLLGLEPRATVAGETFETLRDGCRSNQVYGRLYAARRSREEALSGPRRCLRGLAAPLLAPAVRFAAIRRGSGKRGLLRYVPGLAAICVAWGLGELQGYLFGRPRTGRTLRYWELEAVRAR